MNTLRQAVHEYLSMRRSLGFKLCEDGKALLDFATYMEQYRATYITGRIRARTSSALPNAPLERSQAAWPKQAPMPR